MRLRHVDCTRQCSTEGFTKRNYFSRAEQFVANCLLGAVLPFTMLGVTNCGSNQEQQSVVTTSAKTDSSGVASFEVNGSQFRLNFYDFETQTPISDLSVVLYAKEGNGVYQTYDPNNMYAPMLEGVKAINYQATGSLQSALVEDSHLFGEGTNVFVKTKTECSSYGFNDGLQGKLPEEIFNDKVWRDKHLKPLTDVVVPLSDLDNYLGDVINNLIGEQVQSVGEDAITKDIVPVIIKLVGLGKSAGKIVAEGVKGTFGFAGLLTLTADACSIVEKQSWARYYRSLCYAEDTEFKIYKVTDAWEAYVNLGEITIGFETPQLVVLPELPDEMEPTWTQATAKVSGSIYYRDSAVDLAWKTPETLAKVKFESQDAPYGEVSIYSPMQGNGSYTFIVGACNDPTYAITGEIPVPPLMLQGTTTLKVQNGQEYKLDFYLDKACAFNGNTYETYSKEDVDGKVRLAITCDMPKCTTVSDVYGANTSFGNGKIAFMGSDSLMHIYDIGSASISVPPSDCEYPMLINNGMLCYDSTLSPSVITDLETGAIYPFSTSSICSMPAALWGTTLVMTDGSTLCLTNLATNQTEVLDEPALHPDLYGTSLVYSTPDGVVKLFDLSSHTKYIIGNSSDVTWQKVSGNNVVFYSIDSTVTAQLVDVSNPSNPQEVEIFRTDMYNPGYLLHNSLGISGSYVAYVTYAPSTVHVYDIQGGSSKPVLSGLEIDALQDGFSSFRIYGDSIAVVQEKDGKTYLLLCEF